MSRYDVPVAARRPSAPPRTAYLVASGDLREPANIAGRKRSNAIEIESCT